MPVAEGIDLGPCHRLSRPQLSSTNCSQSAGLTATQPYNNGKRMDRAAAAVSESYAEAVNGLGADLTRLLDSWPRGPE